MPDRLNRAEYSSFNPHPTSPFQGEEREKMQTRDQLLQSARARHSAGDLQGAHPLYQEMLARNPDDVDAIGGVAAIALQTRNFDSAIELFRRALQLAPNSVDAMNNLGVALAQRGRSDEAIELWHRAAA